MGWRDSGQAPFHYSWDEYERVGAYGTVSVCLCVWAYTWLCSLWSCVLCASRHVSDMCALFVAYVCVFFGVVCVVCSGGWAPLLWQLPAAKGLERWHHWNRADLFVRVCVIPRLYRQWIGWELCESERELDQITEHLGTRLTPIPTREERNERKGKRSEPKGKKQQWCLDERREEWDVLEDLLM